MKKWFLLLFLFVPCLAHSQVTVGLLPLPFCGSVTPGTIGAKIQTNVSGTSTPLNTYTDSTGTTPNQNPITLTGNSFQVWGVSGNLYRLIVMDQNSVQQCQVDGISPIGGGGGGGSANWSSLLPGTNTNSGTFIASGNGWDFSLANLFKAPVAAGISPSAVGSFGYDSSGQKWVFFQNGSQIGFGIAGTCGANQWINATSSTTTPTCSQPSVSNLSNGTTGSGNIVLATSPTIATPSVSSPTFTGGIAHGGTGLQHMRFTCNTSSGGCPVGTANWPSTWGSTAYTVTCQSVVNDAVNIMLVEVLTKTTTTITYQVQAYNASTVNETVEVDCIGIHD